MNTRTFLPRIKVKLMTQKDFATLLDESLLNGFTPDLPHLRYKGPIPLFLYGSMMRAQESNKVFQSFGLSLVDDYYSLDSSCDTAGRFVALKAHGENGPMDYGSFLLSDCEDESLTKHPVRGKLFSVSLRALMKFDRYFFNGYRARREIIPIQEKPYSKNNWGYTYLFDYKDLCREGKLNQSYGFKPFTKGSFNNVTTYIST